MSCCLLFSFSFSFLQFLQANGFVQTVKNGTDVGEEGAAVEELVPLIEPGKKMRLMLNETRRKLGSFQICALCTCCGAKGGYCVPTPCCYAISCNIPNRPFGYCSFLPKTCNCFGCHI